jgi:hypothetical protein
LNHGKVLNWEKEMRKWLKGMSRGDASDL